MILLYFHFIYFILLFIDIDFKVTPGFKALIKIIIILLENSLESLYYFLLRNIE